MNARRSCTADGGFGCRGHERPVARRWFSDDEWDVMLKWLAHFQAKGYVTRHTTLPDGGVR
jgi:hypothetical protein